MGSLLICFGVLVLSLQDLTHAFSLQTLTHACLPSQGSILSKHVWRAEQVPVRAAMCKIMQKNGRQAQPDEFVMMKAKQNSNPLLQGQQLVVLAALVAVLVTPTLTLAQGRTGVEIFSQKCAACHKGGGNTVNRLKTLTSDALQKYGYDDVDKAIQIISKGKPPSMPAYGIKSKKLGLDPDEIEAVANYVLEQAEAGWPAGEAEEEEFNPYE